MPPGLDNRCRDNNGEIRNKNGATRVGTLRQTYGDKFAATLCYINGMESDRESKALVPTESRPLTGVAGHAGIVVPRVIGRRPGGARRFLEFFAATIHNKNTRTAYYHAVVPFFAWCDAHKIGEIADIEPLHVAAYIEALGKDFETPTVKQHLAAIRMLFDWLVTGQVVATNPVGRAGTAVARGAPKLSSAR
jgi:hypothetical protein